MKILIACEFSGVVREAFRRRGHDAWSCDLEPAADGSEFHHKGDVFQMMREDWRLVGENSYGFPWDLMIAHPPCTRLTVAGARWFKGREQEQAEAIRFAEALWRAPIRRIALENPIGVLSTRSRLGKPSQIIQPWQFGHGEVKATCLWLKNLPPLRATQVVEGRYPRVHRESPGVVNGLTRQQRRSITYQGIADAMADQWASVPASAEQAA